MFLLPLSYGALTWQCEGRGCWHYGQGVSRACPKFVQQQTCWTSKPYPKFVQSSSIQNRTRVWIAVGCDLDRIKLTWMELG
jgi:hypothetical protein